jgi:hypothetical protein
LNCCFNKEENVLLIYFAILVFSPVDVPVFDGLHHVCILPRKTTVNIYPSLITMPQLGGIGLREAKLMNKNMLSN